MKHVIPVSGGKDSQAVLALLCQRVSKADIVAVHQFTGYDHPYTYAHLDYLREFYGVAIQVTKSDKYEDVFDFVRKAGYFPNNAARGCTSRLKQRPFAEWVKRNGYNDGAVATIYLGMRGDESKQRNTKYGSLSPDDEFTLSDVSSEYSAKEFGASRVRLPIVDWTEDEVFKFLAATGAKVNPLYAQGHKRVGCYPCLLANRNEWELAAKDPVGRAHIRTLLDIEDDFVRDKNPRKLIKVHEKRDVRGLLEKGTLDGADDDIFGCLWCKD